MKKIGLTLLTALLGGVVAVGGYKLLENKQNSRLSFEERQQVHYANNPSNLAASTGNPDFTQAAAAVIPGVVHIKTTYERSAGGSGGGDPFEDMFEEFFGVPNGRRQRPQAQPAQASGSGVIISADGYIVTNNHVVEGADKISVELTNKKVYDAKVIGRDPNTDLALIKVNATGLPIVKLGNSDNVNIGEWVLAVGYPLGLQSTVTAGIVSAKGRAIGILQEQQRQEQPFNRRGGGDPNEIPASSAIESFIQTDAVINKGNSGGALVNANGELIGINSAIMSQTGYYTGYGFAIPVNLVKKIADDFVKFGSVKRGYVGVTFQELNSDVAKQLGVTDISGLYVNSVVPGGGGAAAGLKKGDILTKIEGSDIYSSSDLQERVARLRPGDKVKLTYKREGKEKEVVITLKGEEINKAAQGNGGSGNKNTAELYNKLGAGFIPASPQVKKQYNINSGVVVSEVRRDGLFAEYSVPKGFIITSINGRPVNNVDDVEAALGYGKNDMIQLSGITEDGARYTTSFPLK